jgi:hypothetical protein
MPKKTNDSTATAPRRVHGRKRSARKNDTASTVSDPKVSMQKTLSILHALETIATSGDRTHEDRATLAAELQRIIDRLLASDAGAKPVVAQTKILTAPDRSQLWTKLASRRRRDRNLAIVFDKWPRHEGGRWPGETAAIIFDPWPAGGKKTLKPPRSTA